MKINHPAVTQALRKDGLSAQLEQHHSSILHKEGPKKLTVLRKKSKVKKYFVKIV